MIEHTVKNDLDSRLVTFINKISKILIISETAVKLPVVGGLIAVSFGFEEGTDIYSIAADILNMVYPG